MARGRIRDLRALGGIMLFWLLFCGLLLFARDRSIQWDMVDLHHPALHALARAFSEGRLPHWTPHLSAGYPLLSDPEVAAFYPPVTLVAALGRPGPKSLAVLVCLHLLVAAWGLYALARTLGASWGGAWLGALGYGFGGFLVGNASHLGMQGGAAWLPWLLLAWIRSRKRSPSWIAATSVFLALIALAGHYQTVLFCLVALLVCAGAEAWRKGEPTAVAGRLLLVCTVAGALAAVQILPAAQLGLLSPRRHLAYGDTTAPRLRLASLSNLLFADGFGGVSGSPYVGPWDRTQTYFYPGVGVTLLGLGGFLLGRRSLRPWALALAAVWLYAGGGWLHWAVWRVVPGFASIRGPVNVSFLAQLLLCLSAALFWRDLRRISLDRRRLAGILVALLLLASALLVQAWDRASPWGAVRVTGRELDEARSHLLAPSLATGWILGGLSLAAIMARRGGRGRPVTLLLLLLVMGDLWVHGAENHLFRSREDLGARLRKERESPWLETLRSDGLARFHDLNRSGPLLDWRALIHGVNSTVERTPLRSRWYDELLEAAHENPRIFDLLSVTRFVVPVGRSREIRPTRGRPLFPFTLATELRVVADDDAGRGALATLRPPAEAIVPAEAGLPRPFAPARLTVLGLEANRRGARLRFHADGPGLLVFSSCWHPAWEVRVDGIRLPVLRVDHALMGTFVPAGRHEATWRFVPRLFPVGAALSLLSLTALVAAVVRRLLLAS